MKHRKILSLCDYTGIWSQPYREAGYNVVQVDLQHGHDVRLMEYERDVHGIIAQPPCTDFAGSGARWWEGKGKQALIDSLAIVDACLRFVAVCRPRWWVLENPVGRLGRYLGPPAYYFNPNEFARLSDNPADEAYTKKTCLWGDFTPPLPLFVGIGHEVEPVLGSKMHRVPPGPDRANIRSQTPVGFARAFFEANP